MLRMLLHITAFRFRADCICRQTWDKPCQLPRGMGKRTTLKLMAIGWSQCQRAYEPYRPLHIDLQRDLNLGPGAA